MPKELDDAKINLGEFENSPENRDGLRHLSTGIGLLLNVIEGDHPEVHRQIAKDLMAAYKGKVILRVKVILRNPESYKPNILKYWHDVVEEFTQSGLEEGQEMKSYQNQLIELWVKSLLKLRKKTSAPAEKDMFAKFFKIIYPRIADLSRVVLDRSYKCGQQLKSQIDEKFGKDSKESMMVWIRVQYEFLFLFSHLTIRIAYLILGVQKASNLQGFLGPLLADATMESWFGHWPEELKKSIYNNFFTNTNIADVEYAKCNELPIKDELFSDNSIFSKLAKDVAEIIGCSNDQNAITNIILITVDTFSDMKLEELIKNASSEL